MSTADFGTRFATSIAVAFAMSGCTTVAMMTAPTVPDAIKAPAGQSLSAVALASGVQIYECATPPDKPGVYEWSFKAPEAALTDRSGRPIGKHYAGPTWEGMDGSKVVGDVKGRDPGPDATAIPWLLLTAKSNSGSGLFARVGSIQRVDTVGGLAPKTACGRDNAQQVVRVPYKATYYFYNVSS